MKPCRSTRIPLRTSRAATVALAAAVLLVALAVASPALAGPLVAIDAGHGGPYSHARYGSLTEKAANLLFAIELGARLHEQGYGIAYTRTTDTAVCLSDIPTWHWIDAEGRWVYAPDGIVWYDDGVPRDDLQARSDVANNLGADVFISIHCNGASSSAASGTENWASANDLLGQQLGDYVQGAVLEQTGQRDRGSGVQSFYVTKWANMPALLIETGFMSNTAEGSLIASPWWRTRYVAGIVNGLNRWMASGAYAPFYPRYAGSARSSTAVIASRSLWSGGVSTMVLASVYDPVSALAAPIATARLGAPVIYADTKGLSAEAVAEVARLSPDRIIAVGSTKMLPDTFLEQAAAAAGIDASAVTRLAGTEPADVAPLLSDELASADTSMTVVFASAARTSDALAAALVAASRPGGALVLTRADWSLPPEAVAFLAAHSGDVATTVSVGPVPDAVTAGMPNRTRIGNADAGVTQVAAIGATRASGMVWLLAYNPASVSDGVVATTVAVRTYGVTMPLVNGRILSAYQREWIENQSPRVYYTTMVGDTSVLPPVADAMIDKARR
ncbi:MAG: N-acetylmuramoyl-L-alanine amidase [Coriobacteriia bacterium]|nr:N-acetylmuramoyl-L-alanine amidase [Coriobacteriia bacterium]